MDGSDKRFEEFLNRLKAEYIGKNPGERDEYVDGLINSLGGALEKVRQTPPEPGAAARFAELKKIAADKRGRNTVRDLKLTAADAGEFDNVFSIGESITFINCEFSCASPLRFGNYDKVTFEGCAFKGFRTKTVVLENVREAVFARCAFKDCIEVYSEFHGFTCRGSVISCPRDTYTSVTIDGCEFNTCGGKNTAAYPATSVISEGLIKKCANSVFNNCWHYHDKNVRTSKEHRQVLLYNVSLEANNEVISSAEFCYTGKNKY